jgi:apoptosis-inducing factor 2
VNLGVKTWSHARVVDGVEVNGKYELRLKDGSMLATDLYIPAFGVTPNSSYVPKKHLNPHGYVIVNEFQRVKGTDNVWALGDVTDLENTQLKKFMPQAAHLARNIALILDNKPPVPYKPATSRKSFLYHWKSHPK